MKSNQLISSYDEVNDILFCRISKNCGYSANYDISNGIFLNVDKNNLPISVFISNASEVLNVSKYLLKDPNLLISIKSTSDEINFELFIDNERIYASKSMNFFNFAKIDYEVRLN